MKSICDYMIIQRSADGFGRAVFGGTLAAPAGAFVVVRVMREDDNMTVVPWQKGEFCGSEWQCALTIPEGGLYRVEARLCTGEFNPSLCGYDWSPLIACAYHVGVGDVFVLAGQSNMSGYAKDSAFDPPQLGVHLYNNAAEWVLASHPVNCVPNPVYKNNDCNSGVSPALAFGRAMQRRLGVPVGLISAAQGGSSLESWNPAEEEPFLYEELCKKVEAVGGFKAMVWYQGCNETNDEEADTYYEKFKQTIGLWREKLGFFPLGICQLNRHAQKKDGDDRFWGRVREAQRRAARDLEGVFAIPTHDLFTIDGIHNSSASCITVGERLAAALLKGVYEKTGYFAPDIKRIKRLDETTVMLEIENYLFLRTMDDNACGLNIEDENGLADCVGIFVCEGGATVKCERPIGKNAVFHAYWRREEPAFFIRDVYGCPLLSCYGVPIED